MGPLKNSKHEAFARNIFEGKSGRHAYLSAGYDCTAVAADAAASKLLRTPKVSARVQELKKTVAASLQITKAMLIKGVHDVTLDAAANKAHGAALRGYELLGREYKTFTEHKNVTVRRLADLSEDELREALAELESSNAGEAEGGD